uniref:Uncharacterized protein n=1 Tax=Arion vulgaris TaxID=1028688 RepID=A0A0B7BK26_9EUPU
MDYYNLLNSYSMLTVIYFNIVSSIELPQFANILHDVVSITIYSRWEDCKAVYHFYKLSLILQHAW